MPHVGAAAPADDAQARAAGPAARRGRRAARPGRRRRAPPPRRARRARAARRWGARRASRSRHGPVGEPGREVVGWAQLTPNQSGPPAASVCSTASASAVPSGSRPSVSTVNMTTTGMPDRPGRGDDADGLVRRAVMVIAVATSAPAALNDATCGCVVVGVVLGACRRRRPRSRHRAARWRRDTTTPASCRSACASRTRLHQVDRRRGWPGRARRRRSPRRAAQSGLARQVGVSSTQPGAGPTGHVGVPVVVAR